MKFRKFKGLGVCSLTSLLLCFDVNAIHLEKFLPPAVQDHLSKLSRQEIQEIINRATSKSLDDYQSGTTIIPTRREASVDAEVAENKRQEKSSQKMKEDISEAAKEFVQKEADEKQATAADVHAAANGEPSAPKKHEPASNDHQEKEPAQTVEDQSETPVDTPTQEENKGANMDAETIPSSDLNEDDATSQTSTSESSNKEKHLRSRSAGNNSNSSTSVKKHPRSRSEGNSSNSSTGTATPITVEFDKDSANQPSKTIIDPCENAKLELIKREHFTDEENQAKRSNKQNFGTIKCKTDKGEKVVAILFKSGPRKSYQFKAYLSETEFANLIKEKANTGGLLSALKELTTNENVAFLPELPEIVVAGNQGQSGQADLINNDGGNTSAIDQQPVSANDQPAQAQEASAPAVQQFYDYGGDTSATEIKMEDVYIKNNS